MLLNLLFITFRWLDIVDILMVAIIMFQLYKLVKGTVAIRIFLGILGQFIGVGVLALIIVFQQEIRRFLLMIGNNRFFSNGNNGSFLRLLSFGESKNKLNIA